jgi:hypothetical protein
VLGIRNGSGLCRYSHRNMTQREKQDDKRAKKTNLAALLRRRTGPGVVGESECLPKTPIPKGEDGPPPSTRDDAGCQIFMNSDGSVMQSTVSIVLRRGMSGISAPPGSDSRSSRCICIWEFDSLLMIDLAIAAPGEVGLELDLVWRLLDELEPPKKGDIISFISLLSAVPHKRIVRWSNIVRCDRPACLGSVLVLRRIFRALFAFRSGNHLDFGRFLQAGNSNYFSTLEFAIRYRLDMLATCANAGGVARKSNVRLARPRVD